MKDIRYILVFNIAINVKTFVENLTKALIWNSFHFYNILDFNHSRSLEY